jgi:hypothetical protein
MNAATNNPGRRGNLKRYLTIVLIFIVLLIGEFTFARMTRPHGPKLLNRSTAAREVRPLTTKPDPRFAPLPIEREKHAR